MSKVPLITLPAIADSIDGHINRTAKNSQVAYRADLKDFSLFTKSENPIEALHDLVLLGADKANLKVEKYRDKMSAGDGRDLSGATINRRLSVLRGVVRLLRKSGLISWELNVRNVSIEDTKDMSGPGLDPVKRLLKVAAANRTPAGIRNFAILRILAETGLRRGELCGLDVGDFNALKGKLNILGKGKKRKKEVEISKAACVAITAWLHVKPRGLVGPLFVNMMPGRHGRLTGSAVFEIVRAAGKRIGMGKKVRPHGLRHTAITEALKNADDLGLTYDQVKAFSRHKDPRMLFRYRDPEKGAAKKIHGRVSDLLD